MSIKLNPITSGYQLSKINENFQRVEDELNNKVLRRDGLDVGEDNSMQVDLDMNSHSILNATTDPNDDGSMVTVKEFKRAVRAPHGEALRDLPPSGDRLGKVAAFDVANGDPIAVDPINIPADLAVALASSTGATMVGVSPSGTVQKALYAYTPEMFGAIGDGVANDTAALQAAINACRNNGVYKLVGKGTYRLYNTVTIAQFSRGFDLDLYRLVADVSFPAPANWDTATPLLTVGDTSTNMNGIYIRVQHLDGNNLAAGIMLTARGASSSHFHVDLAVRCQGVYKTYQTTWPNASNLVTGGFWTKNTFGVYLRRGQTGTTPIVEGHKINVKFIAGNTLPGILIRGGSQYAQLSGDLDFNGTNLVELEVPTLTGISNGTIITNGTVTCEVMARYNHQDKLYILAIEDHSVINNTSSFAVGNTITATDYSQVVTAVRTVDNTSNNFYFDIVHDFRGQAFAKAEVNCGYLGGIVGELLWTSNIDYRHSTTALTNSNNGLMVTNSGTSMALYNTRFNNLSVMEFLVDKIVAKQTFSTQTKRVEGIVGAQVVPSTAAVFTNMITLPRILSDTYLQERNLYKIYISGHIANTAAELTVQVATGSVTILSSTIPGGVYEIKFSGQTLQIRQQSGQNINILVNAIRYA